jgi:hypothetical protein
MFRQYELFRDNQALAQSVKYLAEAKSHYHRAYEANPTNYWVGGQWICLSAIVDGYIADPFFWEIQHHRAVNRKEQDGKDFWVCGTLAELLLIAPLAGRGDRIPEAEAFLEEMKVRVEKSNIGDFPIESTRRQLTRYPKVDKGKRIFQKGREKSVP